MNLPRFVAGRIAKAIVVVIAIVILNFFLIRLAPGDPAQVLAGEAGAADEKFVAQLRQQFRLDEPLYSQLWAYLKGVLTLDLGFSYQFLDDVADVVAGVAEVGKERGMDAEKLTAVDLFGVDGARRRALEFQDRSLAQLEGFGAEANWLRNLVCEASWKAS